MSVKAVLVDGMVVLDDSVVGERTIIAGASPGPQVDLSTLGNGVLQQTVTAGVAALSVTAVANANAKFIVQQPDSTIPNAQALSALTTGLVKNTTTTGVLSIAVDGVDYVAPADLKYQTVQIGGSSEPQQQRLNFISGATATNNPGNNSTDINISGASIYADGIVTGVIELASVSAALLQVGSEAYVASVDDYFSLQLSALTPDDLTVVTASGRAGYQWVRLYVPSLQWAAATAWWVDPVSGNDEAVGTSSLSPLKTYAELSRRLRGRATSSGVTVNMVNDATDADLLSADLAPMSGTSITIVGIETQLASGTVATFVGPSFGPGGNTLNQVSVVGFNWAPYVGFNVRKHGASGGTGVYASVLADLGGGSATIAPTALNGSPSFASYFQAGDVIEVVGFTKAPQVQTSNTTALIFTLAALYRATGVFTATMHGTNTTITVLTCSLGLGATFGTVFQALGFSGAVLATKNSMSTPTSRTVNITSAAFTGVAFYSLGTSGGASVTIADSVLYPTTPSTSFPLVSIGPSASVSLTSRTSPGIGVGIFNLAAGSVGIVLGNNSALTASNLFGANNNAGSWILAYPSGTKVSLQRSLQSNYYEASSAGVKTDWVNSANVTAGSTIPNIIAGWGPEFLDRYQSGRGPAVASASRLVPQGLLSFREWSVTGTSTINTITTFPEVNGVSILNDGLLIELDIQGGLTITNNASNTPLVDAPISLAGGVNAVLPAGSHITLRWNASYGSGTGVWTEVSRDSSTALSVLGNPTAAPALTQPIASTGANLFLGSNAANTGLAFVPVGPLGTTGLVATWPIANARWYAVDGVNGNDANVGFSDVSEALAGAVAKQTIAGLGAIMPRLLDGRRVEIVIANGGVNTALAYTDPLDVLISGIAGGQISIKATGTNANAGSTAFAGTSASDLYAGAITVTGLNSAGYNPIGTPTTTVIQCAKNGGGSPAFPAEPAAPLQWRIRFDIATATVALRGICKTITKVAGTDTLTINSALSVAPAAGDVFYIEQAGVQLTNTFNSVGSSGANMNFIGLDITGTLQIIGSTFFQFMLCRLGSYQPGVGVSVNANRIIASYGRNANVAAGGGLIIVGQTTGSQDSYNILMQQGLVQTTQLQLISSVNSNVGDGAVLALGVYIDGGVFASDTTDQIFGGVSIAMRVLGSGTSSGLAAGVGIAGARIAFGLIDVEGVGAHPAIALRGTCDVNFAKLVSGSTGNTDVGLDLTLSKGSRVVLTVTPTVTGTGGDVRLSDGTIVTWAQALVGIQDSSGNKIIGAATPFPIQRLPAGTYLTDLSAGGIVQAATGTGLLSPTTIGLGLSYTGGTLSATNVASWPIANMRFFAADGTNGNDANAGFSDVSMAAAGLVAVKTIARLLQIIPRLGNGRQFRAEIRAGAYASDAVIDLSGFTGYLHGVFSGTDTVVSAGSVAFAGDTNDQICAGMTTATGLNAGGYNVTAYSVDSGGTPTATVQIAGGGAPGFGAMPARPYGCRFRFDSATTTVALRNVAVSIVLVPASNQLMFSTALPASPVSGDVGYIEQPNVTGPTTTLLNNTGGEGSGNPCLGINGIVLGSVQTSSAAVRISGCETTNVIGFGSDLVVSESGSASPTGFVQIGCSLRNSGQWNTTGGNLDLRGFANGTTPMIIQEPTDLVMERFASGAQLILYGGAHAGGNNVTEMIGTNSSTAHGATAQIWGSTTPPSGTLQCGLFLGGGYYVDRVRFSNMGANPCVRICGAGLGVSIQGATGGVADGNTDVGVDFGPNGLSGNTLGAVGCNVAVVATPTVTGSVGDVRLPDGTIVTWAQALVGIQDSSGNKIIGAATPFPIQRLPAGTYLTDLSAGGFASATTGTGLLVPRVLTNTDGTVSIANPGGVGGNPVINTSGLVPAARTVQGTAPVAIAGDHAAHDLSVNRVWSLDANGVTYAFIQQVSASKLLGNPTGSPANVSEIGVTAPLFFSGSNLILDYDASSLVLSGGTVLVRAALTGDVAASVGLNTTTIQPNVVSYAKIQQASAHTLIGNPTGSPANVEEITLGAGLTFSGTTIVATGTGGITQLTGDVTAGPGSGSLVATLVNIPNDTTMAGDILTAQSAAPATPAANHGRIWFDSTAKNYFAINESGSKFHMVESLAPAPSQFLTGVTDTGTWDAAQPAFTDITGTVAPAQLGSFTNGSVLFWSGGLAQDNANFFWDVADHRLAIGHSSANYPLDVASSAPTSQVHFSDGGGDIGGYLLSTTADQGILSGGTAFNGTNWIAKATSAAILSSSGGSISLTGDTGLTVGAPFSPTSRIVVSGATGVVSLSSLSGGGLVKSAASTGALSNAASGVDYQPAGNYITALTGAVSATGPGSAVATLSSTGVAPGTYVTPTFIVGSDGRITSASFTNTYQTIESDGTPVAAEAVLNFIAPLHAADSGGSPFRTNATLLYDSTASFFLNGSSQLQLKNVGPGAGTIGGSGQYISEVSLDAQGRVTGATAVSSPPGATYKFSINAATSAGILSNLQSVIVPGDSGPVPTGSGIYVAPPAQDPRITLAAAYGTAGGPVAYGTNRTYTGIAFQIWQNYINVSVANGADIIYVLYVTPAPTVSGSYLTLSTWNTGAMNIGTGSGLTSGILTAAVSIAAGDLLILAAYRSDIVTTSVVTQLMFTATIDLIV